MPNLNIALSDEQYARLVKYKENRKPHLSMRAIIVEAVEKDIDTADASGTQVSMPETDEEREVALERIR